MGREREWGKINREQCQAVRVSGGAGGRPGDEIAEGRKTPPPSSTGELVRERAALGSMTSGGRTQSRRLPLDIIPPSIYKHWSDRRPEITLPTRGGFNSKVKVFLQEWPSSTWKINR